jgi:hypothetical protein
MDNLFFSCRICNQKFKKNHFPLTSNSKRASSPDDSVTDETCLLIDPSREDPEETISWDWTRRVGSVRYAFPCWRDDKGQSTVRILGLDHGELARERGQVVDVMLQMLSDYKRMLDSGVDSANEAFRHRKSLLMQELLPERPFLGLRRYIVRAYGLDYLLVPVEVTGQGAQSALDEPS